MIDTLAQPWADLQPYAFPLFILLGRCNQKIRQERVRQTVLIAPVWGSDLVPTSSGESHQLSNPPSP